MIMMDDKMTRYVYMGNMFHASNVFVNQNR
jgi:hypothetical protein